MYDSYKIESKEWSRLLTEEGDLSIRGTELDAQMIGLWVHENEGPFFVESGFDGFYTYFASEGFVYGSTSENWKKMSQFALAHDLIFIPSVGPGYSDTRIRPWNGANFKSREGGEYYRRMFEKAKTVKPKFISITSFNEWHEGTQIEPAVEKKTEGFVYEDYGSGVDPGEYLRITRELVDGWE
jgi:glycoprotein endo-alpha-1,2-mannosidase